MTTADIETLAAFDASVAAGRLAGAFVQSLDLRGRSEALRRVPVTRTVFLGCDLRTEDRADLTERGALIFPQLPDLPFNPYRTDLYTAGELYEGLAGGYPATVDGRIYRWYLDHHLPGELEAELACTLHDHAIVESLDEDLAGIEPDVTVGVMGGHAVERGTSAYAEAARLGHGLAAGGHLVATGGGPGAMEAANLGAAFAGSMAELDQALTELGTVASWSPSIADWAQVALTVQARWDLSRKTLGIPTWFYGHEPPNAFATGIAKFFSNAVREDTLLRRCRGGLVYLPGAAGTVQEVFQAVTPNYYAQDAALVAPLVLVDRDFWTRTVPAWPLLRSLAAGRPMAGKVALVDSVDEAMEALRGT